MIGSSVMSAPRVLRGAILAGPGLDHKQNLVCGSWEIHRAASVSALLRRLAGDAR